MRTPAEGIGPGTAFVCATGREGQAPAALPLVELPDQRSTNTTEHWGAQRKRAGKPTGPCSKPSWLGNIRAATNGNYALGSRRFQAEVAARVGRRVTRGKAGRPPKDRPLPQAEICSVRIKV